MDLRVKTSRVVSRGQTKIKAALAFNKNTNDMMTHSCRSNRILTLNYPILPPSQSLVRAASM